MLEEYVACGIVCDGCDSDGNIHWLNEPNHELAARILAAHGQPLSSDECQALQAVLTEQQWLAYQEARKAPVRAMRAERYRQEADPLILSSIESALAASTPTDGKYEVVLPEESVTNWISVKNSIRVELPYGE